MKKRLQCGGFALRYHQRYKVGLQTIGIDKTGRCISFSITSEVTLVT